MAGSFLISELAEFLPKVISWLRHFEVFCLLNSNGYYIGKAARPYYHSYDLVIAAGAKRVVSGECSIFPALNAAVGSSWLFGYLSYDLKNEIERLESKNPDRLQFPDAFFFEPEFLLLIRDDKVEVPVSSVSPKSLMDEILLTAHIQGSDQNRGGTNPFKSRFTKSEYLDIVQHIRQHIIEGDVYEMNFCQEFYIEDSEVDPFQLYPKLCEISPNPFSAFCRIYDRYILSSSMERFLKKEGQKLISQPIKGTIKRGISKEEDRQLAQQLQDDEKERAENVMIVDLVRNDLSKSCKVGSVKVEELFGIYPFPNVHQMISTVTGELREEAHPVQALCNAFPMGSMTGAPKLMAMKLIEKYERSKRGVFSGAIGYFSPTLDFDFNVVIRTLLYDAASSYLSLTVGSAITYDSVPEKEYAECLVKIEAIKRLIEKQP